MNTVHVTASKSYNVLIGAGLLSSLGALTSELSKAQSVAVISDTNVWPLYGEAATKSLVQAGFRVVHYVFPAGEESKNGETFLRILNFLAENKLTRSDLMVALGGGVVGDITGFAASAYLRGISFVQVPTSLLAMVDSSVGGKTAIDLPAGKNLAGAFYQPILVLCDTDALNTLPEAVFRDGCAEVIKYGILYDPALFEHLSEKGLSFDREAVISRCIALKRDVVAEDEFDTGARQKLNLGHTIGHSVEASSNFTVTHGQAVAIGTAIVTKAAAHRGLCTDELYRRIITVIDSFGLPTSTHQDAETLFLYALSDKKRSGGSVNLIVPREIGECFVLPTPVESLKLFIEAGL